jgi:AcrR family transcriptional regulator
METKFSKLKPRPGRAGRDVKRDQRARLYRATIELVAERGYKNLTVTAIARTAGVANRTFYENFQGKEDCFLRTYEAIVRSAVRGILAAQHRERDLQAKVTTGMDAFLTAVAENPKAAHLVLVEALEVDVALERTRHTTGLFAARTPAGFHGIAARHHAPRQHAIRELVRRMLK